MKKKVLGICIVVLMLVALVSGCTENKTTDDGDNGGGTTATELSNCIKAIQEADIPTTLDDCTGTVLAITEPFGWDPESTGEGSQFDVASGYMGTYQNEDLSKMIITVFGVLENTADYNTMSSDVSGFDTTYAGILTTSTIKGAKVYIVDYNQENDFGITGTVAFMSTAGDNAFISFGFIGYTVEEATTVFNTWLDAVC